MNRTLVILVSALALSLPVPAAAQPSDDGVVGGLIEGLRALLQALEEAAAEGDEPSFDLWSGEDDEEGWFDDDLLGQGGCTEQGCDLPGGCDEDGCDLPQIAPPPGSDAPASAERSDQLARIHRAAGVPQPAPPLALSPEVMARAEDRGGQPVILYNEEFLAGVDRMAGTRWASTFILAHELGHCVHRHAYSEGPLHQEELEADAFAARTLRAMGATLAETEAALRATPEPPSETHPGVHQRLRVIEEAYRTAAVSPVP